MAEEPMEAVVGDALWRQFGGALAMLDNAIVACPESLWRARLWEAPADRPPPSWMPPEFATFWHLAYHTLFWFDLYLAGTPEEEFAPPAPFIWTEGDPAASPERPYTKEDLRAYLTALRRTCHATLAALTAERARRGVSHYGWLRGQAITYVELQLYNLRHVQEHVAQLSLFLGQHGVPDKAIGWVARAKDAPDSD